MRWLLAVALACGGILLARAWPVSRAGLNQTPEPATPAAEKEQAPGRVLPPAARLRVRVAEHVGDGKQLLDPDGPAWEKAVPTKVLLSRTPRIYRTEPVRDLRAPDLEVRSLRSGGKLYLRLRWDDTTENAPKAPPRKTGKGGVAEQLYKRPTGETRAFADAAAVMFPERWTGPSFPSLLMGDRHAPARLFYWNASRGAEELTASGRATPAPTGKTFAHRGRYAGGRWTLVMGLPDRAEGWPLAFAVWDGETGDRDGLKYFSIWYVLSK
jgi:DMSO reductase family type II enzyme heme b subunit